MDLSERSRARDGQLRHPWEAARASFFRHLVPEAALADGPVAVLDIGAGDGWFAEQLIGDLPAGSSIVCFDAHYTDDDLAESLPDGISRVAEPPVGTFDVVFLLDVLEHVEDDRAMLDDVVVPAIRPDGGVLVASVPAHPWLFTAHDEQLGHFRRYRPDEFRTLLAGRVEIVRSGELFTSLIVPRAAVRAVETFRPASDDGGVGSWKGGPLITSALTKILSADARMGLAVGRRGVSLPGLSTWAIARAHGGADVR